MMGLFVSFFFFKRKSAYEMRISDWSSDVCASDLPRAGIGDWGLGIRGCRRACSIHEPRICESRIPNPDSRPSSLPAPGFARPHVEPLRAGDRTSVVKGKSVGVRVDLGGRRLIKKNINTPNIYQHQTHNKTK